MTVMRILFVDDDEAQRDLFTDAVKDWNEANPGKKFDPVICEDAADARDSLEKIRFDCALFDLKFRAETGAGLALTGNELAQIGLESNGIPIGIISGQPDDLAPQLAERRLLKTFVKREGACDEAVSWLGSLWQLMEVLGAARRQIQRSGAEIFAKRIWPRWEEAYSKIKNVDQPQLEAIVTRQYAGHIAELLGIDDPANPGWHPFENYIDPALQENRAHTGDLFRIDGEIWVVLTPQCDMATQKVESVLLAHCDPNLVENWFAKVKSLAEADAAGTRSKNLGSYFTNLINQNVDVSLHFLPPLKGNPLMVNFKRLTMKPLTEVNAGLRQNRIASVSPPFLTNLTQRFGNYISRTGQPNIEIRYFGQQGVEDAVIAAVGG